ncbi:hypothetical protein TI03_06600, partial [Achromatium sp. WMS1]
MPQHSQAWLLKPTGFSSCAVAEHETLHYNHSVKLYPVPCALPHCNQAIYWQGHLVPVMHLGQLIGDQTKMQQIIILAYQDSPGIPLQHLALGIDTAPIKISVDDQNACKLPQQH